MKQEFKIISSFIKEETRVLDVGCGDGTLMEYLKTNKEIDIRGIEISKSNSQKCVSKGLTVGTSPKIILPVEPSIVMMSPSFISMEDVLKILDS